MLSTRSLKATTPIEVQIDFDKNSSKAIKVDVTSNLWQAEATDKALGQRREKAENRREKVEKRLRVNDDEFVRIKPEQLNAGETSTKKTTEERHMSTLLLIILVLLLIGALPTWPYSSGWGYYPSGGLGLILIVIIILVLMGRV